jgi:hypothetical protein
MLEILDPVKSSEFTAILYVGNCCAGMSTNGAAQTGEGAVARRLAAGRCAVPIAIGMVHFSFGYFSFGQAKEK